LTVVRSSIWNGSGARGVQHLQFTDRDLDLAGGQVGFTLPSGPRVDDAGDLDAELVAQVVDARRREVLVADDDLARFRRRPADR
jgi:hypothetical protein